MPRSPRLLPIFLILTLFASPSYSALFRRSPRMRGGTIALRQRLHVNTLITEPGTFEVEWNNSFNFDGSYSMPTTFKYTPQGSTLLWGRTEYSVSVDGLSSQVTSDGYRTTHLSDHATLSATTQVVDSEHRDVAVAPVATMNLRGDSGARLGATAILRHDRGLGSGGATFTWTGATNPSSTNPAGVWDFTPGYGRKLAACGLASHVSLFGNATVEKTTSNARTYALIEGMELQFTDNFSWVVSSQQTRVTAGQYDKQIVTGLTVNFGRPRTWFQRR